MKKPKASKSAAKRRPARKAVSRRATPMRAEYDFSGGVRGKYAREFARGANVVVLAPDVADEFPTASAVNRALRAYLKAKSPRRTA
jgi:hypothetical protein